MDNVSRETSYVTARDAEFPSSFPQGLEFSSPARGVWNIVHTGMLIPESHQIFVCAKGCLRGVVLTAAEMGMMGRYSAIEIQENNVLNGGIEELMIDGVADCIRKLPKRPRCILIFINCQHFFLAYDQKYVFRTLRENFPDIEFADCYMIPTLRKSGITPDQKMRIQMYSMLKKSKTDPLQINLIGSNHKIDEDCELYRITGENGFYIRSLNDCNTFDDYLSLSKGRLNIIYEPLALNAAKDLEKRLGTEWIYLPGVFNFEDIKETYRLLSEKLGIGEADFDSDEAKCREAVSKALNSIGQTPIAIDYTFTFRILSLARFLLENGFNVTDIFADTFLKEEEADFLWIKSNFPGIRIWPTNQPDMRFKSRFSSADGAHVLALGQKAAYFKQTENFVNISEGGGFFGFDGIRKILELMTDAFMSSKPLPELIQRKGCGCESLLDEKYAERYKAAAQSAKLSKTEPAENLNRQALKSTWTLVPTYSSDEFGACSALYELGGMVVMHDASGCNSTYTTHDEPRWYSSESMIYISAISEAEAILGDDNKLISDVIQTAQRLKPAFVAIVGAPIPYMTGTDLKGIAGLLKEELGIPCFGIYSNGMQSYQRGISMAEEALVQNFALSSTAQKKNSETLKVNVLGATPLDLSINGSLDSLDHWLQENGMENCFEGLEQIKHCSEADVSLVVSWGGLKPAKLLKETYGIPYVIGAPIGKNFSQKLAEALKNASQEHLNESETSAAELIIIGESVTSVSLAREIELKTGKPAQVICPVDCSDETLRSCDISVSGENEIISAIQKSPASAMIADPFYRPLCPAGVKFYELPHEAFSGRIYEKTNPDLIDSDLPWEF